jgi:hypothetical protein
MAIEVNVPVLDGDGQEPVTWLVDLLEYRVTGAEGSTAADWRVREVEAAEVVVIGGALVFRDGEGGLVLARGPGSWGEIWRKPVTGKAGRH